MPFGTIEREFNLVFLLWAFYTTEGIQTNIYIKKMMIKDFVFITVNIFLNIKCYITTAYTHYICQI